MIIAEQQIDLVNTKIFREYDRLKNFNNLPPAHVRLTVRLPGADEIGDALLKIVLYVRQTGPLQLPWTEEGRLTLSEADTRTFQSFDALFCPEKEYKIRLDFLVAQVIQGGEQQENVGYAETRLSHILCAEDERLDVDLMTMSGDKMSDSCAELAVEWLRCLHDRIVLEVHVRVERRSGWPFSSARPFFVLYKWEAEVNTWTPIYRSEVLSQGVAFPDSRGALTFELAEIVVARALEGDEKRPLRLEFFHYKTKCNPKMLGSFETSVRRLRVSRKEPNLKLQISTLAEGELVGELRMTKSKLTAGRSYYCLEATFGGDIVGDFVYFDVSLTDLTGKKGWKREGKPYYTIARYSDTKVWEKIYRSESASRVMGRLHKYKVAKLTERRLNDDKPTRPISIMLFKTVNGQRMVIGHIETAMAGLLAMDAGTMLPLEGAGVGCGYLRVEQTEERESHVYFALHFVLERSAERSTSTEDG